MKHIMNFFWIACLSLILFISCPNPSGGISTVGGNSGGSGEEPIITEITNFTIDFPSYKIRPEFATMGTTIAKLGNVKGGTPPFTFQLKNDGSINYDNSLFRIDGNLLKINSNILPSTYNLNINVIDDNGKSFSKPVAIIIYPEITGLPVAALREVSRGVTLQGWTEIKSGLAEGEAVIVQGQQLLSGGERLRIVGGSVALGL